MRRVVVFDLDDTLYKEVDFLKSAYEEISLWIQKKYSINDVYEFMIDCYYSGKNVFMSLNEKYLLNIDIDDFLCIYRNHIPDISLEMDTDTTLREFLDRGYKLGIITDGRVISQKNKIESLGLRKYISEENCIISESFGYGKPSIEGYSFFFNKWGTAKYYYVGDNISKDFIAPNQLGWDTVCLLDDGRNIHKQNFSEPSMNLPKYTIAKFVELLKIID